MTGSDNKKTDFNDLMIAEGEDAVRAQIDAVLESAEGAAVDVIVFPAADAPVPAPVEKIAAITLEIALQRFSLALPDAKVWDAIECKLLKQRAVQAWWGKDLFKQWLDHETRATVNQSDVLASAAASQARGNGDLAAALNRYIYLYGSQDVWDVVQRCKMPVAVLRIAIANVFDEWVKHSRRREIRHVDLVFNPGGPWEQEGRINTFRGMPMKAADNLEGCRNIRALLWHLCNEDDEIFTWLKRWLALPLQKVGSKLASAVIMHSDVQGAGKSLFFDCIMRPIYGEYGATLGQHQMESQYTEWRSQVMYALFEEIFSRDQKYSHIGQIKHMVSGKTHRLEQKYVSSWEEANHMNAVFLSNEFLPIPIEPADRRMLVVWPEKKLPEVLRIGIVAELENGGINAFYGWLMAVEMGDFHAHTEPPMTAAKQRLIDFGRPGWDLFHRDWSAGDLDVPYQTCLVNDLYRAYKSWCHAAGEKSLVSREKFSAFISSKERRLRDTPYWMAGSGQDKQKGTFFKVGEMPEGKLQVEWLGECVAAFRKCLKDENS